MNKNWYRKHILAFRNELDLFTRNVAEEIFKKIKIEIEKNNFNFNIDLSLVFKNQFKNFDLSNIVINVKIDEIANNNFLIGGSFNINTSVLYLNIIIDKRKFSNLLYSNFLLGLNNSIRHELEHAKFRRDNPHYSPNYLIEESGEDLTIEQRINLSVNYLNDYSEIQSFIRQIMLSSKRNKTNFLDNISDVIWFELYIRNGLSYQRQYIETLSKYGNAKAIKLMNIYEQILDNYIKNAKIIYPDFFRNK